ncbi:MAG: type pullulanase, partial [Actinomycetota bacterium]
MRRILSALVAALLAVTALTPANALNETTELTIHYSRFEGDYKDWNLWLWPKGGEGKSYEFTEDDSFGKVARVKVPGTANVQEIGIIVRLGEWQTKDVQQDRFITKFENGKAEIWLIQADPTIYYAKPVVSTKLSTALMKSFTQLELTFNRKTDAKSVAQGLSVIANGKSVPVSSVNAIPADAASSNRFSVRLDQSVELGGEVSVSHPEYGKVLPELGGLFSSAEFDEKFFYQGEDLGASYAKSSTKFRLWAPTATAAELLVYSAAADSTPTKVIAMDKSTKGTWTTELAGDQHL